MIQILVIMFSREVLECFRKEELLKWAWFDTTFSPCLLDGVTDGPATDVFCRTTEVGVAQWEDFRKRVVEHVSVGAHVLECEWERGAAL